MSTSLLYHGFSIRGYQFQRCLFIHGRIIFKIKQRRVDLRCPLCGSCRLKRKGEFHRLFRTAPIGLKPVFIEFAIPRVACQDCGVIRQVKVAFADARRSYTHHFQRYVLALSRHMTIRDVATLLGIGWDMVKDIQKRYLAKRFRQPKLGKLRQIAIDEISIGRAHRYLTVVLDLASGAVVFVGNGKGADALKPFWRRLKRSKARIEAVAIDMSPAYIRAVTDNLPDATLVFDHFHIIKLYNDGLSDLRRQLHRETQDKLQQHVLKGTRWLLLKGAERLNDEKDESVRLRQALEINEPLASAYYLKEDLRQLWKQPGKRSASNFLKGWIQRAKAANIAFLNRLTKTFEKLRKGILAYYDYRISTGPLEGTNNKIKTLQRQAYGFRDMVFFKLKIYALHLSRYALVG